MTHECAGKIEKRFQQAVGQSRSSRLRLESRLLPLRFQHPLRSGLLPNYASVAIRYALSAELAGGGTNPRIITLLRSRR